ncbi:MAG: hypothetical protein IKZ89_08570 [Bacteroidaceae bacterium]|nr:hypothetical protein [Bacteroidaceae bacterium]
MNFESLVGCINHIQDTLQAQTAHAVNLSLTTRNWLVGYHIVEFEQHGEDRAKYGEKLLNRLSKRINRKGFEPRSLRLYRRIYLVYPQLGTEIEPYLQKNSLLLSDFDITSIWQSAPAKLQTPENPSKEIWQSALAKLEECFLKLAITILILKKMGIEDIKFDKHYHKISVFDNSIEECDAISELLKKAESTSFERTDMNDI